MQRTFQTDAMTPSTSLQHAVMLPPRSGSDTIVCIPSQSFNTIFYLDFPSIMGNPEAKKVPSETIHFLKQALSNKSRSCKIIIMTTMGEEDDINVAMGKKADILAKLYDSGLSRELGEKIDILSNPEGRRDKSHIMPLSLDQYNVKNSIVIVDDNDTGLYSAAQMIFCGFYTGKIGVVQYTSGEFRTISWTEELFREFANFRVAKQLNWYTEKSNMGPRPGLKERDEIKRTASTTVVSASVVATATLPTVPASPILVTKLYDFQEPTEPRKVKPSVPAAAAVTIASTAVTATELAAPIIEGKLYDTKALTGLRKVKSSVPAAAIETEVVTSTIELKLKDDSVPTGLIELKVYDFRAPTVREVKPNVLTTATEATPPAAATATVITTSIPRPTILDSAITTAFAPKLLPQGITKLSSFNKDAVAVGEDDKRTSLSRNDTAPVTPIRIAAIRNLCAFIEESQLLNPHEKRALIRKISVLADAKTIDEAHINSDVSCNVLLNLAIFRCQEELLSKAQKGLDELARMGKYVQWYRHRYYMYHLPDRMFGLSTHWPRLTDELSISDCKAIQGEIFRNKMRASFSEHQQNKITQGEAAVLDQVKTTSSFSLTKIFFRAYNFFNNKTAALSEKDIDQPIENADLYFKKLQ